MLEIHSQVRHIHAIAMYLDDNINVLHIESTKRIEKEVLQVLRGLGILIKLLTTGEVDSSDKIPLLY
ncbi:hypothetical protein [Sphingobacterium tabacisoli]|uniref:hypothetical protein n=1 Tax=Sphingobacterium tabacisoli TaxID=2044855 RepID=UPI001AEEFC92|nr:hypothetical protein [Sphingobacterium tabacisoli]